MQERGKMQGLFIALVCVLIVAVILIPVYLTYVVLCFIARREPVKLFEKLAGGVHGAIAEKVDDPDKYVLTDREVKDKAAALKAKGPERMEMTGKGGLTLVAYMYRADVKTDKLALLCHGCRSNGLEEFAFISDYYHARNYDILMVDHRACGESQGKYMTFGLIESEDSLMWLQRALKENSYKKAVIHGVSMGAATVLMMSGKPLPPQTQCIIAESSYTSAWDQYRYILKDVMHLPVFPLLHALNAMSKAVAFDFKKANPLEAVRKAQVPVLFFHGGADTFVPEFMSRELYEACSADIKEYHEINDSIHARCYVTDTAECERIMDKFIERAEIAGYGSC